MISGNFVRFSLSVASFCHKNFPPLAENLSYEDLAFAQHISYGDLAFAQNKPYEDLAFKIRLNATEINRIQKILCIFATGYDAVSDLVVEPFPRRSEIQDQ